MITEKRAFRGCAGIFKTLQSNLLLLKTHLASLKTPKVHGRHSRYVYIKIWHFNFVHGRILAFYELYTKELWQLKICTCVLSKTQSNLCACFRVTRQYLNFYLSYKQTLPHFCYFHSVTTTVQLLKKFKQIY